MIKVGCMSLSYKDVFPGGDMTLEDFLEKAYEMRLDGVDLHTRAFASTEDSALREVRRACHRRGLAISYLAVSNNFGKTDEAGFYSFPGLDPGPYGLQSRSAGA